MHADALFSGFVCLKIAVDLGMIKNFRIFRIFYGKLLIPAVAFSLLMCFSLGFTAGNFGLCFLLLLPAMHFLIYEIRFRPEYYFYAHFGFSKKFLWMVTISISILINLITKFL